MKVFLATDGSTSAQAAEQVLATFPFAAQPQLTIATVCPAANLTALGDAVTQPVAVLLERCRQEADQLLQQSEQRCQMWTSSVEKLLLDGHPADELLQAIERVAPDLVVVGARGLGAVRRFLLGSVSERIVKHAPCSVLVAHPPAGRTSIESIVLAYDGSACAEVALARFISLPLGTACRVHILSVVETIRVYGTELLLHGHRGIEAERNERHAQLQMIAGRLAGHCGQVTTEVRCSSDVSQEVLSSADQWRADLIVLGSQGRSAWDRFLLGSTALQVLHQAPCSIWIERAEA